MIPVHVLFLFFFFNDTATTEIYTLSLHDALPISPLTFSQTVSVPLVDDSVPEITEDFNFNISNALGRDRKSTRLNSSHLVISYAVFCLKKKITNSPYQCQLSSLDVRQHYAYVFLR